MYPLRHLLLDGRFGELRSGHTSHALRRVARVLVEVVEVPVVGRVVRQHADARAAAPGAGWRRRGPTALPARWSSPRRCTAGTAGSVVGPVGRGLVNYSYRSATCTVLLLLRVPLVLQCAPSIHSLVVERVVHDHNCVAPSSAPRRFALLWIDVGVESKKKVTP